MCLLVGFFTAFGQVSSAQNAGREDVASARTIEVDVAESAVRFGIDGRFRSGRWTPLMFSDVKAGDTFEVQALDGEAVRYIHKIEVDASEIVNGQFQTYLPAGPPGAPLEVRKVDSAGNATSPLHFRKRLVEGLVEPERPWVVAFGSMLELDAIGQNEMLGVSGSLEISLVRSRTEVPSRWFGYDGVDVIAISGSSIELLKTLDQSQQTALKDWILGGGNLLISLGSRGPELFEASPWLAELLRVERAADTFEAEPEGVETFVSARAPISSFTATRLSSSGDVTMLAGRNSERQMVPLITLHAVGLGKATVFAGGLDEKPFFGWKQYGDFIDRMLPDLLPSKRSSREGGSVGADVRYKDVAGQVRVSLDRFAISRGTGFSVIAALVLALIGLIGPVDYLLVNRWLGRPLLGWLSFPLTIAAFSIVIVFWNRETLPNSLNRITLLDMDSETKTGRGFTWAQFYADSPERFDLQYVLSEQGRGEEQPLLTQAWGYAGSVYGGIEVAGEDVRLPKYELDTVFQTDKPAASKLLNVPLASKSSRGIASRWLFEGKAMSTNDLRRRPGSDLLSGSLLNPFDADFLDGYLVFRNLAYVMPTRVPAKSRISAVESLPTKNFRWRLNRRQTTEETSRSEPWNPASDDSLDRLLEIVMFYEAAGGSKYVGLNHRELSELDFSDSLAMDKAVLVGRLSGSPVDLQINGSSMDEANQNELTYVRMIFPITNRALRGSESRN